MKWEVVELLEELFTDNILLAVDRNFTFSFAKPRCPPSDPEDYMEPGVDYFV